MARLTDVFGLSAKVDGVSYVDRGGLDEKFKRALQSEKHIAIHGGSKQGKSWLRTKGLYDYSTVIVQCTPDSTPATLLREALGRLGVEAVLKMTRGRDMEGTLDFKGAAELGKIIAKLKGEAAIGGAISSTQEIESEPIGKTAADLSWVATTIEASGRRLVLEDFHYLSEDTLKQLAFLLKAMGEYGLHVVIVGVWPRDHLLTYYNGDLEGRIDDIHLQWIDDELGAVLRQGSKALEVRFADDIATRMVTDSYGNVGLLQRIAEQICLREGVTETQGELKRRSIGTPAKLEAAERAVAEEMQGRFQTFADNFVRGMRRLPEGLEVYRHLLDAVTQATDDDLMNGIDSQDLLNRVLQRSIYEIRPTDLTQALDRIDRLQARIDVHPPVLTYNRSSRKVFLADHGFLFYRKFGDPHWPWNPGSPEITNDLAVSQPLEMDDA